MLGSLTALSPFAIDMYLPAFPQIAEDFGTPISKVALSLSSYFIGLSIGQLFYGPLLDRFGRKRPLYFGLFVFFLASLGCLIAANTESLVALRFVQALGGCVAGVASMSMVRDLFSVKESSKILSLLVLVLSVSPMLAPTIGGFVTEAYGWHSVFIVLGLIALMLLAMAYFFLPESHKPDESVSLRLKPIAKNYFSVLKNPQFYTYCFAGSILSASLFVYVASSPIIFLGIYKVSGQMYGWIFAGIAFGLISASQINILLLKKFENSQIMTAAIIAQSTLGIIFLLLTMNGWIGIKGTIAILFCYLSCVGLSNPNAASLALAPFKKNTGSAAALLGFCQMGLGALASMVVGFLPGNEIFPITVIFAFTSILSLTVLTMGRKKIRHEIKGKPEIGETLAH